MSSRPAKLISSLRQNTLVRRRGIPIYRVASTMRSFSFPPPGVIVNSVPKAGTHLLSSTLDEFPQIIHSGHFLSYHRYMEPRLYSDVLDLDREALWKDLKRISSGQYGIAHLRYNRPIDNMVNISGLRHLFIIRDPRDMVLSLVNYILNRPYHALHRRFANPSNSHTDRLSAVITGFKGDDFSPGLPSVAERLERFSGWFYHPSVCLIKFEDLIGPLGGGDSDHQIDSIVRIGHHIDRPVSRDQASAVAGRAFRTRSATFYRGLAGAWQQEFRQSHRALFKEVAQNHLQILGYEDNPDW